MVLIFVARKGEVNYAGKRGWIEIVQRVGAN